MKNWMCAGAALAVVLVAMSSTAFAQRDAGAKARGEFGRGFWNSSRSTNTYRYVPSYSATQASRVYSYQPIGVNPGDMVKVTANHAKLMDGRRVVTTVDQGQEFEVGKVTNGWLRAEIERDGKKLEGWIWHKNVRLEDEAK
ncbi:MAG: hypothetical protein RIC55_22020 [Pirellulaceae bacterium]